MNIFRKLFKKHVEELPKKVHYSEAQQHVDGLVIAEIIRDAQIEFRDQYPDETFQLGVGPMQSMIGLAIKNGHLKLPEKG
jgi:hypothetical protein